MGTYHDDLKLGIWQLERQALGGSETARAVLAHITYLRAQLNFPALGFFATVKSVDPTMTTIPALEETA